MASGDIEFGPVRGPTLDRSGPFGSRIGSTSPLTANGGQGTFSPDGGVNEKRHAGLGSGVVEYPAQTSFCRGVLMVPTVEIRHSAVPAVPAAPSIFGNDGMGTGHRVRFVLRRVWRPARIALLGAVSLLVAAVTVSAADDCGGVRGRPGEALVVFTRTKMMGYGVRIEVRFGDGTSAALSRYECAARSMPPGRSRLYAQTATFTQELTVPARYLPRLASIPFRKPDAFGMATATKLDAELGPWVLPEDIASDPTVRQKISMPTAPPGGWDSAKWTDTDLQPDHTYYFAVSMSGIPTKVHIDAINEKQARSALRTSRPAPYLKMNDDGTYSFEFPAAPATGDAGAGDPSPKKKEPGE